MRQEKLSRLLMKMVEDVAEQEVGRVALVAVDGCEGQTYASS